MTRGTSAPHQHYPVVAPAPRSDGTPLEPDTRDTAAPDQAYPAIVPADQVVVEVCKCCGSGR